MFTLGPHRPLQTDNHASTPPLSFLQAGCPSCRPTNIVKALKASYELSEIFATSSSLNIPLHLKFVAIVTTIRSGITRVLGASGAETTKCAAYFLGVTHGPESKMQRKE